MSRGPSLRTTDGRRTRQRRPGRAIRASDGDDPRGVRALRPHPARRRRARDGAPVPHEGVLEFAPAPGGRGTELTAEVRYATAGGRLAAGLRGGPEAIVREGLRRVKAVIEAGEIPTVEGQPSARSEDAR